MLTYVTSFPVDFKPLRCEDALEENTTVDLTVCHLSHDDRPMPFLGEFASTVASSGAWESQSWAVCLRIYIGLLPSLNAAFVEAGRDAIRAKPGILRNDFEWLWKAVCVPASIATITKKKLSGIQMTQTAHTRLACGYVCLVWVYRGVNVGKVARSTFFDVFPKFLANLVVQDDNPIGTDLTNCEDVVAGLDA
jgi:hypothetical protein